jgi:hypothetical protein
VPTISIFFGIVVQMYWRDHPPPHVHVFYQGFEALVAIEDGETIGGRLPIKVGKLCRNGFFPARQNCWRIGTAAERTTFREGARSRRGMIEIVK